MEPREAQPSGGVFARAEREPGFEDDVDGVWIFGLGGPFGDDPYSVGDANGLEGVEDDADPIVAWDVLAAVGDLGVEDVLGVRHDGVDILAGGEHGGDVATVPHLLIAGVQLELVVRAEIRVLHRAARGAEGEEHVGQGADVRTAQAGDAHAVHGVAGAGGGGSGVSLSRGGRGRAGKEAAAGVRRGCQTAGRARGGMLTVAKTARRPHPATRRRTRRRAARERGRRGGRAPRARRSGGGRDAPKRRVREGRAGAHHLTRARVQLTEASGGGGRQVSPVEKRAARPHDVRVQVVQQVWMGGFALGSSRHKASLESIEPASF